MVFLTLELADFVSLVRSRSWAGWLRRSHCSSGKLRAGGSQTTGHPRHSLSRNHSGQRKFKNPSNTNRHKRLSLESSRDFLKISLMCFFSSCQQGMGWKGKCTNNCCTPSGIIPPKIFVFSGYSFPESHSIGQCQTIRSGSK